MARREDDREFPPARPQATTAARPDPLADIAPVYSVDELAPVYAAGSPPQTASTIEPPSGTTSVPVVPIGVPTDSYGADDDLDYDDEDDGDGELQPGSPVRIAVLVAGLLFSLALIVYGVNGIRQGISNNDVSSDPNAENADGEDADGDGQTDGGESGDTGSTAPVQILEGSLELQPVDLGGDVPTTPTKALSNGASVALLGSDGKVAVLDLANRSWTAAPAETPFNAIGASTDGLVAVSGENGAKKLSASSDGGATWTPIDGADAVAASDVDLVAQTAAGVLLGRSEAPGDNRAEAAEVLSATGITLPADMVAGASSEQITYFDDDGSGLDWWKMPTVTIKWQDFGLEPQSQWAPSGPRILHLWNGGNVEDVADPFGPGTHLLDLGVDGSDFVATVYDGSASGYARWRSSDGKTWSQFDTTGRPPLALAPLPSLQRVNRDGVEWQIVSAPDRDPVLARRTGGQGDWEAITAAEVIGGAELEGYIPRSIATSNAGLTITLDAPDGQNSVIAQSEDGNDWKTSSLAVAHIEALVSEGPAVALGVSQDPSLGSPTLSAVSSG